MPFPAFHRAAQVLLLLSQSPVQPARAGGIAHTLHAPVEHIDSVLAALARAGIVDGDHRRGFHLAHRPDLTLADVLRAVRTLDRPRCRAAGAAHRRVADLLADHFHRVPLRGLHSPRS